MNMRVQFPIILLALFSSSCHTIEPESVAPGECSALTASFFGLPLRDQISQFSRFDLDRQYVIYICGNQAIHPPAMYLAEPLSKSGNVAIPLLTRKLMETRIDFTIRDIIYVFSEMQSNKTYDVAADKDLLRLMEDRASGIRDKFWREYTQQLIVEISRSSSLPQGLGTPSK